MQRRPKAKIPQWFLVRVWQYLHEQACHGDHRYPVAQRRWSKALERFENRHLAARGLRFRRTTARFVNKYTAHRWL